MKKNFDFWLLLGMTAGLVVVVFLFIYFGTAQAAIVSNWQNNPSVEKDFNWVNSFTGHSPLIQTDTSGHFFWQFGDGSSALAVTSTLQTVFLDADGWKLWRLGAENYNCGSSDYSFWYDTGGDLHYSTSTQVNTFDVDGAPHYLCRFDGFDISPVKDINVYGADAYFIVYTDEDLGFINSASELYSFIDYLNSVVPPDPLQPITLVYPYNNSIEASTTVNFFENYLNGTQGNPAYSIIGFRIIQTNNYFTTTYLENTALDGGENGYATTTTLAAGSYSYQGYLRSATSSSIIYSNDIFNFSVIFNPYAPTTTPSVDCSKLDIFSGALCYAFTPSQAALNNFTGLYNVVINKAPFGYLAQIKLSLDNFGASTTPAFILATIAPINNSIILPIRTGLAFILYIFFAWWLVKRISHITI